MWNLECVGPAEVPRTIAEPATQPVILSVAKNRILESETLRSAQGDNKGDFAIILRKSQVSRGSPQGIRGNANGLTGRNKHVLYDPIGITIATPMMGPISSRKVMKCVWKERLS